MQDESKFVIDESGKLLIEPYMEELPDLFVSYFKAILMVGHGIPRLEYYMSQGELISNYIFNYLRFVCVLFYFFFFSISNMKYFKARFLHRSSNYS